MTARHMSIGSRIALLCAAPLLVTVVVGGFLLYQRDTAEAVARQANVAQAHATQLGLYASFDVLTEDEERLHATIDELGTKVPDLVACRILGTWGDVITEWVRAGHAFHWDREEGDWTGGSGDVLAGGEVIGQVELALDLRDLRERLASRRFGVVVAVILVTAAIAMIAWFEGRRLSRSIGQLARVATRIAGGEYGISVREGGGEIGVLASAFNAMSLELAEAVPAKVEKEAAVAANQAKSEFLASMSHELRTPLHAVLSFAKFGRTKIDKVDRAKLLDYFHHIEEGGRTLLLLLNDLLDLAKLEAHRMDLEFRRTDLCATVSAVLDEFEALFADRGLTVRVVAAEDVVTAMADGPRISQVVRNLLSNAAKFSPEGGTMEVTVQTWGDQARVAVKDEGPGVPEDEIEVIFDHFVQSSKTKTKAGGTGLGLAICREIVVAHGGHVWVQNDPDGGAVFTFEIPRTRESTAEQSPVSATGDAAPDEACATTGSARREEGGHDDVI